MEVFCEGCMKRAGVHDTVPHDEGWLVVMDDEGEQWDFCSWACLGKCAEEEELEMDDVTSQNKPREIS